MPSGAMTQQPGAPAAGVDYEGLREQYATQKEAELAAEEGDVVKVCACVTCTSAAHECSNSLQICICFFDPVATSHSCDADMSWSSQVQLSMPSGDTISTEVWHQSCLTMYHE